jgi:hypothetical protein
MTRFFAALLVAGAGAVTAGCSSAESTAPAVCTSTDALQASMSDLGDVQVIENGTAALDDTVAEVRSALQDVADDASSEYATQVDHLQVSFDALQAATGAAVAAPSAATLSAVTASVTALTNETTDFADDIASTC